MVKIRKFVSKDGAAVKQLITRIMESEFREELNAYPPDDLLDISKAYGNIGEVFLVAESDGKVVGTIGVKRDDERRALLRRFFVDPEMRGKKVGKRLLEQVVTYCKEMGYQEIVVRTTMSMRRAIKLCTDQGFTEKAHVDLGGVQLCKFALFLRENSPLAT